MFGWNREDSTGKVTVKKSLWGGLVRKTFPAGLGRTRVIQEKANVVDFVPE